MFYSSASVWLVVLLYHYVESFASLTAGGQNVCVRKTPLNDTYVLVSERVADQVLYESECGFFFLKRWCTSYRTKYRVKYYALHHNTTHNETYVCCSGWSQQGSECPIDERKPVNLSVSDVTSSAFTVTWKTPRYNVGLKGYTVFVRKLHDTKLRRHEWLYHVSVHRRSVTLNRLTSGTSYSVKVQANYNITLSHKPYASSNITTNTATLPEVSFPDSLRFTFKEIGNSSLLLQCLSPSGNLQHDICLFHVSYYPAGRTNEIKNARFYAVNNSFVLRNLQPWKKYKVKGTANTCTGRKLGVFERTIVRTRDVLDVVFTAEVVTPWTATLTWRVNFKGNLTLLRIQREGDAWRSLDNPSKTGHYIWRNLQSSTTYHFLLWVGALHRQRLQTLSLKTQEEVPGAAPDPVGCSVQSFERRGANNSGRSTACLGSSRSTVPPGRSTVRPGSSTVRPGRSGSGSLTAVVVGGPVAVAFAIIIVIVIICVRRRHRQVDDGTRTERTELISVNSNKLLSQNEWLAEWPDYGNLQFDRTMLEILEDIGEGQFGKVHLAVAHGIVPNEDTTRVAVKALKNGSSRETALEFRDEMEIMMAFDHPNIITLLGVCTKEEPFYIITELMTKGDLKQFLTKVRPNNKVHNVPGLSVFQLLDVCHQVATGLAYLAKVRFVHRDVSARNCLVGGDDKQLTVKVADFGMSKDVYQTDYCRKSGGMLPIRWMAPEAITDGRHTSNSDIWSFGVLIWEVFSFGYQPYFGIPNSKVVAGVTSGNLILQRPTGCPRLVYDLMQRCWKMKSKERAKAADLCIELASLKVNEQLTVTESTGQYLYVQPETLVAGTVGGTSRPSDNKESGDSSAVDAEGLGYVSSSVGTATIKKNGPHPQVCEDTLSLPGVQFPDCPYTMYTDKYPIEDGIGLLEANVKSKTPVEKLRSASLVPDVHHVSQDGK